MLETAFDPTKPYYDTKSIDRHDPRWYQVHVAFRRKLHRVLPLPELRSWGKVGGPLKGMDLLRLARLSVSKVSAEQWDFLMEVVNKEESKEGQEDDR